MSNAFGLLTIKFKRNQEENTSRDTDSLAEWSKALASGASPQGRGFEPHSCHCYWLCVRWSRAVSEASSTLGRRRQDDA